MQPHVHDILDMHHLLQNTEAMDMFVFHDFKSITGRSYLWILQVLLPLEAKQKLEDRLDIS